MSQLAITCIYALNSVAIKPVVENVELLYPKKIPFVKKSSVKRPGRYMNCCLSVSSTSLQFE